MKHTLLSAALLASFALTACQKEAPADTAAVTPPAETPATAPMTPAPAEPAMGAEADATAQAENPMVGGAPMYADRDIVTNASASPEHTTLVSAVQAAGLVDTLKGPGPFTVFAPTNAAFAKLPAGTVDGLLAPDKKADLTKVLTYHVVPGNIDAAGVGWDVDGGGARVTATASSGNAGGADVTGCAARPSPVVRCTSGPSCQTNQATLTSSSTAINAIHVPGRFID